MKRADHTGSCLRHRRYHLTCEEFAVLLAAFSDQCGICSISGTEARPPRLVIDHDHEVGNWAVRGMLCSGCNRRIRDNVKPPPEAKAYLASPWYIRRLADRGISLDPLPEPTVGTMVGGRGSYWHRTTRGWEPVYPKGYSAAHSWIGLNHLLGPYNIWIPPKTDPRYQIVRDHGRTLANVPPAS